MLAHTTALPLIFLVPLNPWPRPQRDPEYHLVHYRGPLE